MIMFHVARCGLLVIAVTTTASSEIQLAEPSRALLPSFTFASAP